MKLLADLHVHTKDDPEDGHVFVSPERLFCKARRRGINVICLSYHNIIGYNDLQAQRARHYGITLLPGLEKSISKQEIGIDDEHDFHILVYGTSTEVLTPLVAMESWKDILSYKKRHARDLVFCLAHPFLADYALPVATVERLIKEKGIDALEYDNYYGTLPGMELSDRATAADLAGRYDLPLLANSDTHFLAMFGHSWSELQVGSKDISGVIQALKDPRKVAAVSRAHSWWVFGAIAFFFGMAVILARLKFGDVLERIGIHIH
ncbi:MAG: PHP domain-containing protein [Nanoarchaeota archaeon]